MYINPDKLVFNCFGCDWKGSIFTFIMLYQQISFSEAVDWLKEIGNFQFNSKEFLGSELAKRLKKEVEQEQEEANPLYLPEMKDITSQRIWEFFKRRHISKRVALNYGAKVCLEGYYQGRIILPVLHQKKLYGFEARLIQKADTKKCLYPRYSSLKSIIFDIDSLNKEKPLYFTEGMMDCLSLKSRGYWHSSCGFGSKLKKQQIKILQEFKEIILIPDNDSSNKKQIKGGEELVNLFYEKIRKPTVKVVTLAPGKDIDEYSDQELHCILQNRKIISDYIVDRDLKIGEPIIKSMPISKRLNL